MRQFTYREQLLDRRESVRADRAPPALAYLNSLYI
jgi:hypothetical protein